MTYNAVLKDTIGPLMLPCATDAYPYYGEIKQAQEQELWEVSKAGAAVIMTGLLSPDMAHNCQEWIRTNHANYLSYRAGSVKRRGDAAGLRFDYAWGKAKETINSVCASLVSTSPSNEGASSTGMQPTSATPDHFKELGRPDWFVGQAAEEFHRGTELFYQGDYDGAIQAYQSAQIHHGKPSTVLENKIGIAFLELGNHQQAIDHFTKAIEIEDGPTNRVNRAQSYIETDQCPPAIHDAQQALDMKPESTDGYHTDAEAHRVLRAAMAMALTWPLATTPKRSRTPERRCL